jgi:two-component system response regulator AlgR
MVNANREQHSAPRVLIVDDEPLARERLKELLGDCRAEVPHDLVGEAGNGLEALDALAQLAPDIVLVDIHMPGMSGLEFARHAQLLQRPPAIVFVTAHDAFALQAFEVNAVDYLLKPVRAARLAAALAKAGNAVRQARAVFNQLDAQPRRFFSASERGRIQLVPVGEVMFLRSGQKYITVHSGDREFLIEDSLSGIEEEFPGIFIRIHRNCLVARRLNRGVEKGAPPVGQGTDGADTTEGGDGWMLVLEGCEERLPVSRRQWPAVKTLLKS